MNAASSVAVTGTAITSFNRRKDGSGFRDWAFDAVEVALQRATVERADIDALFVASESDFFSLQLNPASVLATDLGLVGVSAMRVEGGGASGQLAVHAAVQAVLSGHAKQALVVGVDPSASSLEAGAMTQLYGFSFDAWTDGMTGTTATELYALSYQRFAAEHRAGSRDLAAIVQRNRALALHNPGAHLGREHSVEDIDSSPMIASPYRRLHCSPLSDGAAALVLSAESHVPETRRHAARIIGIGSASDHMHLGTRANPGGFAAKSQAMQRACHRAKVKPADIDVAEIYDAYAGAQLQAAQALGLSDDAVRAERDGQFAADGRCPINLSGGLLGQGAPVGASGVAQTASCALMLEGNFHPALQPTNTPRYAVADTHGGVCTLAAVSVLCSGTAWRYAS